MDAILPINKESWLKMRKDFITSTDISALFGISPYKTAAEVFFEKKNKDSAAFEESERMRWGSRLEAAIAEGVAIETGWALLPKKDFYFDIDTRMGSSFDYEIPGQAIVEIKNVDSLQFKKQWEEDESGIQPPLWIQLQVQYQMMIASLPRAHVCALVGGNRLEIITVEANQNVQQGCREKVKQFWDNFDKNIAPPLDMVRDTALIRQLYANSEEGLVYDGTNDSRLSGLALSYKALQVEAKKIEDQKTAITNEALTIIGSAEKAFGSGWTLSAKTQPEVEVKAHVRKAFRAVRFNVK